MTCLASCTRQENLISTFTYKFPNKMFLKSPELFLLLRKLWWSCRSSHNKCGPKRQLLNTDNPGLCPFYDGYIYNNQQLSDFLASDKPLDKPIIEFLWAIGMPDGNWTVFEQELMVYATNNMVKISAYIESPYVTVYETTQVKFLYNIVRYQLKFLGMFIVCAR